MVNYFNMIFRESTFLGVNWGFGILLFGLVVMLISRDMSRWGDYALTVTVLLGTAGIPLPIWLYVVTAMFFVLNNLDTGLRTARALGVSDTWIGTIENKSNTNIIYTGGKNDESE